MTKQARWAWALTAVVVTALVLVVTFVLALTGEVQRISETQVLWLFRINVAVAGLLALVIGGSLLLFALRAHALAAGGIFAPLSREGGLVLNNVSSYTQQIVIGLILILAVAFDRWLKTRTRG